MRFTRLKFWIWLHKWSSLIAMLVLLLVFISGLPLVFKAEIENWLGYGHAEESDSRDLAVDSLVEEVSGFSLRTCPSGDKRTGSYILSRKGRY